MTIKAARGAGSKLKWMLTTLVVAALLTVVGLNVMPPEKKIDHRIDPLYAVSDPQFVSTMGSLLGPALLPGNRIVPLINGDQIFPAMLAAIRDARRTITLETYIYWSGAIGKQFARALTERARAGVKVHVLLDWVGSGKMEQSMLDQLEQAGVQVEKYHPLHWYTLARLNNRTHRKLLVVDGRVGFTGGVGIADQWLGNAESKEHWRDSHFQLEGPAVAQMQAAFMDNWIKTRAEVLHGEAYFPALEPRGDSFAQVFMSSHSGGSESIRLMYLLSITAARKSIRLENAYFVPDDLAIESLLAARKRGVDVQIIVPGSETDVPLTRRASRARWGRLLESGVQIYEYQPTMYHCKVMIVDGRWVSVGSTNFDNRSFRLNDEANLNIMDEAFAREQMRTFEEDKTRARRITLEAWKQRPLPAKLFEHVSSLFGSQL